jgi:DNA-binding MarR family transcriptional regulator
MHAVSFALKRAHLRAVAYGLEVVEDVRGMTPARFDLLYLLRRRVIADADVVVRDPLAPARSQSGLCKDLGLHRSTVARMLKRLSELGWIKKTRCRTDRRTFDVALTRVGLRKIARAMRRVFRMRVMRCTYENILCRARPKTHVVAAIDATLSILRKIAYAFGDRSRVWYHHGGKVAPTDLPWDLVRAREVHRILLRAGVPAWPPPPPSRRTRRRDRVPDAAAIEDVLADPEIAAFLDRDDGW